MAADRSGLRRNVDVGATDLPVRLHDLRTERRLSKADLAKLSGLSARSIGDIENGRRQVVQQATIFLLAKALGVTYEDLVGRPPEPEEAVARPDTPPAPDPTVAPAPSRAAWIRERLCGRKTLPALLLIVLLAAGVALREQATASPRISIEDWDVVGRDLILGLQLWRYDGAPADVVRWYETPWGPEKILFGMGRDARGSGAVVLAHRRTGRPIWKRGLDHDLIGRAFPEDGALLEGHEYFKEAHFLQLDGDDQRELLVWFADYWDPRSYLCLFDADGAMLGQYCHLGSLTSLLIQDLDGDGKDEILAAGQNMADCVRGASFVRLEDTACRGASRDTLCGAWGGLPDSSRARLTLPSFGEPYMGLLGRVCLDAVQLRTFDEQGQIRICADVGCGLDYVIVTMDADLRPLGAAVSDAMIGTSLHWPEPLRRTGPADPAWLSAWLARGTRFEYGRAVPGAAP